MTDCHFINLTSVCQIDKSKKKKDYYAHYPSLFKILKFLFRLRNPENRKLNLISPAEIENSLITVSKHIQSVKSFIKSHAIEGVSNKSYVQIKPNSGLMSIEIIHTKYLCPTACKHGNISLLIMLVSVTPTFNYYYYPVLIQLRIGDLLLVSLSCKSISQVGVDFAGSFSILSKKLKC